VTTIIVVIVSDRLREELHQARPFDDSLEEATLNVLRTADVVERTIMEALKPLQLTMSQYNVLRILRGAESDGRTCGEIGDRMVTHDPDVTRMLDRLHSRGLVSRERSTDDRRVVRTKITKSGLRLLDQAEMPLKNAVERRFGHLGRERLLMLIDALEALRTDPA
jgi:DNA-binding MarR family transcriptional regulator